MKTNLHDTVTVEANTIEEALGEVSTVLGADAQIVSAERVPRGGIGGFFAREVVQLTARPSHLNHTRPDDTDENPSTLDRLLGNVDQAEASFGDMLRLRLGEPTEVGTPSIESAATEAITPVGMVPAAVPNDSMEGISPSDPRYFTSAPTPSPVLWSVASLTRVGAPTQTLEVVGGLDPRHDLAWVNAIAGVASTLCRPFPEDAQVMAGPRADRLGEALGWQVYQAGDVVPYQGSFCVKVGSEPEQTAWLESVMAGRLLHLVVDDDLGWRPVMVAQPSVVSWTATRGVGPAMTVCAAMGAVLGFGMDSAFGAPARRANPIDVALALRDQMERG